ncbi:amidohydrolase family protein [Alkalibaculum sp. M08DMB]|uniref:Amidohydrolase family protein n=1 Tax=Alkalibaculum sporogenes TaxID=2655001 RepID=A0A6A7KDA8_9FIRM|nr:amidohydrolase family protein [Alkalibaculum sporogenes]MPW27157.1 amidohydrolase family protein [Alkalibaculum sporogenes]
MITKQEFVKKEKYLKLNKLGDFIIDYDGDLNIIDFHTHMSNVLPLKVVDPRAKGNILKYKTLPNISNMDLSVPYWTKHTIDNKKKGLLSVLKFSSEGYTIFKDMTNGGTYENCFKSQEENKINRNIVLPISSKKYDRSLESLKIAKDYPDKFTAFCSVHPNDSEIKEKLVKYKTLGAKGYKLKITDLELKNNFTPLIEAFKICYEIGFPVLLHTGSLTHIDKKDTSKLMWKLLQSTRVEIFGELLNKLPKDFKFIFGHSGIGEYKLVAKYLKQYPATYTELSCQSTNSIQYLINEVGYERLLFGSDWPALPQSITLSRVLSATEDNQQAREYILMKNAEKLLNI